MAIRHFIRDLLKGKTDAGQRVFANRAVPVWESELPCILIYTREDPKDISVNAPREYRSNLQLVIEIIAEGYSDSLDQVDDVLDALASQVEYEIDQDHRLSGHAEDLFYETTSFQIRENGNKYVGALIMTFRVPYLKSSFRDPATLVPLAEVFTQYKVNEAVILGSDSIMIPTGNP